MEVNDIKKQYRKTLITGLGMIFSLIAYVVMAEVFIANIEGLNEPFSIFPILRIVLIGIAIFIIFFTPFIVNKLFKIQKGSIQNEDNRNNKLLEELQMKAIIRFSVYESIGIFGLLLYMTGGGSRIELYCFVITAIILQIIHFPKLSDWKEKINNI